MLPRLRPWADRMRQAALVPAFLLASIAASGLAVDLLKIVFGRTRPKLLFADGTYDFSWLGLAADYWSFPSGHTAAVAALATALWCLWPRHVLFYIALASVVAASRVVTGAHYLSDVVVGGFVAVLVTRAVAVGFTQFRLEAATRTRRDAGTGAATALTARPREARTQPVLRPAASRCSVCEWRCASRPSTMSAAATRCTRR